MYILKRLANLPVLHNKTPLKVTVTCIDHLLSNHHPVNIVQLRFAKTCQV